MRRSSILIGGLVFVVSYLAFMWLLSDMEGERVRMNWIVAFFLTLGGPHLLSILAGIVLGGFAALNHEVKLDDQGKD